MLCCVPAIAKLYGVILRILNRGEWAEDCLQEAYVKVWHKADSYRPQVASLDRGYHGSDPMLHVNAVEPAPLPAGKVCQLWLEAPDGSLIPVGILPHAGSRALRLPSNIAPDGRFKVSIESADKVPVERPSEEIVFEANLRPI